MIIQRKTAIYFDVGVRGQESVVRGQGSVVRGQEFESEFRVGVGERSWRREWGAFLASDAVARMCGPNCEIYMGDGIRSERLGNIPQSGTWARAVPKTHTARAAKHSNL